jgi:ATP-binding cassette subfamily B protein
VWTSKALLLLKHSPRLQKQKDHRITKWDWIQELVREDLNILTMAMILGIVVATLGLSTAVFSQQLLDDILPSKDVTRLVAGIGLLAFLLLAKSAANYIRQLFLLKQSKDFNTRVISHFYARLLQLP